MLGRARSQLSTLGLEGGSIAPDIPYNFAQQDYLKKFRQAKRELSRKMNGRQSN